MDDITQKYEFQEILRDAAEYRVLRRIMDAGRGIEVAEMEKRLGASISRRLDLNNARFLRLVARFYGVAARHFITADDGEWRWWG